MKGVLITHIGLEEAAAKDVGTPTDHGVVHFSGDPARFVQLCRTSTLAKRMLLLLHHETVKSTDEEAIDTFCAKLPKENFLPYLSAYRVVCERTGGHLFTSTDVERAVGEHLEGSVSLQHPTHIIYIYIHDSEWYAGVDLSGDLSKRDYKVLHTRKSIKGTIASGLLELAGYKKGMNLLDPFAGDGTIVIEAARPAWNSSRMPFEKIPSFIDIKQPTEHDPGQIYCVDPQFKNIHLTKKNAKIANVEKLLTFSRMDLRDVDLKVEPGTLDCIVTIMNALELKEKTEFFHQADLALKKNGTICVLSHQADIVGSPFTIIKQQPITIGTIAYAIVLRRGKHEL